MNAPFNPGSRALLVRLGVRLIFALGAMALFVFGYQWGNQYQFGSAESAQIQGVLVQPPGEIPEFSLRDPFGRESADAERLRRIERSAQRFSISIKTAAMSLASPELSLIESGFARGSAPAGVAVMVFGFGR